MVTQGLRAAGLRSAMTPQGRGAQRRVLAPTAAVPMTIVAVKAVPIASETGAIVVGAGIVVGAAIVIGPAIVVIRRIHAHGGRGGGHRRSEPPAPPAAPRPPRRGPPPP